MIRLVGAVLAEQTNQWRVARRYLGADWLTAMGSAPLDDAADSPLLAEAS